jgi:N-ethylmaleimide reductase
VGTWPNRTETEPVAFSTLYIANSDLVDRFKDGKKLSEPDRTTFYRGGATGYTTYEFSK